MKNLKRMITILLIVILLFCGITCNKTANAAIVYSDTGEEIESAKYSPQYQKLFKKDINEFEFNAIELLRIYSLNSATSAPDYRPVKKQAGEHAVKIPVYAYTNNQKNATSFWNDNMIDAVDASTILCLGALSVDTDYVLGDVGNIGNAIDATSLSWNTRINDIKKSLGEYLNISDDNIEVTVDVVMPKIQGYTDEVESYKLTGMQSLLDNEILNKIDKFLFIDYQIQNETPLQNNTQGATYGDLGANFMQEYITVTAKANNEEYKLYVDSQQNFYLVKPEDITDFSTELNYKAVSDGKTVEGKFSADGNTFLPPYYENEDKNAKKDTDAIAIIKSKTQENIIATNDVQITNDGKPNSQGWYYPDVNNKTIIEKIYKFDTYNNPTDNGAVKETVKLTGETAKKDTQNVSIEWTLRRIDYTETKNNDGSTTVTITYNLPIEKDSIPEGWEPIVDKDNGIRKITRTFKTGESYDKDVIVEQNGPSTKTVTTHVTINSEKLPEKIIQAGATGIVVAIAIAGILIFMITRYRKLTK